MNLDIVFEVVSKRWKQVLIIVLLATISAAVVLFIKKPLFKSTAVFAAANPNLGDRSAIYRTQFWQEYLYYGGEPDNERLLAVAKSEEMNRFMVDSFQLIKHYGVSGAGEKAAYKANCIYKKNVRIHKNENGHIEVNVWDTDKQLAAQMANAIVNRVNEKSIAAVNNMKLQILEKLKKEFAVQKDSLIALEQNTQAGGVFLLAQKNEMIAELNEKEKLIQQFRTSVNDVNALFVIEEALPAFKKDKPNIIAGIITAAIVSTVFSILLLLLVEWNSRRKQ